MEESGHYYTVYFTSLAVGFDEETAYKQAVYAQMGDEVGWLDAANVHVQMASKGNEIDLDGKKRRISDEWRIIVEQVLHSLTGGSSETQRIKTVNALGSNDIAADSPKFGMLLHRLGDTFAHSIIDNEKELYASEANQEYSLSKLGHFWDGHAPDYPYLRSALFIKYLDKLYDVLAEKLKTSAKAAKKSKKDKTLKKEEIKNIYNKIFKKIREDRCIDYFFRYAGIGAIFVDLEEVKTCKVDNNSEFLSSKYIAYLIEQIRVSCEMSLNKKMKAYKPELTGDMTLEEYLKKTGMKITSKDVYDAVAQMKEDLKTKAEKEKEAKDMKIIQNYLQETQKLSPIKPPITSNY